MKMQMRVSGAAALALAVGACFGGEPSESDMAEAMRNNIKIQQAVMLSLPAPGAMEQALKTAVAEKSACKAAQGEPGYVCDFRFGSKQTNGTVRWGEAAKGRFYKVDGKWAVDLR
jgi:hypothetical protein